MIAPTMPLAPTGLRWFAESARDGWITLRLGPAEWDDARMLKGPISSPGVEWPAVLVGLSGSDTRDVMNMAFGLVARYRERFPEQASDAELVAAINAGLPLPVVTYPRPEPVPPRAPVEFPAFRLHEWVRLGATGKPRRVTSLADDVGFVGTMDLDGRTRRCYAPQLVRVTLAEARRIGATVR